MFALHGVMILLNDIMSRFTNAKSTSIKMKKAEVSPGLHSCAFPALHIKHLGQTNIGVQRPQRHSSKLFAKLVNSVT